MPKISGAPIDCLIIAFIVHSIAYLRKVINGLSPTHDQNSLMMQDRTGGSFAANHHNVYKGLEITSIAWLTLCSFSGRGWN